MARTIPTFQMTGKVTISIKRYPAETLVKGRPVAGQPDELEIEANVQPFKFHHLMYLPESDRTKEWINVYSAQEIRTAQEGDGGYQADEISWDGKTFIVRNVRHYQMGVLDHYHAQAVRERVSAL